MFRSTLLAGLSVLALAAGGTLTPASAQDQDVRKDATASTKAANDALKQELPFENKTDFENAHRGFIAALPSEVIKGDAGNVIWNPGQYGFIKEGDAAPRSASRCPGRNI